MKTAELLTMKIRDTPHTYPPMVPAMILMRKVPPMIPTAMNLKEGTTYMNLQRL